MQQEPPAPLAVAVVSDHRLLVEGLSRLLAVQPGIQLGRLDSATAPPGVVVLAGDPPEVFDRCRVLSGAHPGRVLLVGTPPGEEFALAALRAGARGLVTRTEGFSDLLQAIRVVARGQVWADQDVVAQAVSLLSTLSTGSGVGGPEGRLTGREQEIFRHTLGGLSNREIADRMDISPATVKAHLTSVFRKLAVRDRTQLVVQYRRASSTAHL
jgi:DNA-binding NarL/FixJ family response regulator